MPGPSPGIDILGAPEQIFGLRGKPSLAHYGKILFRQDR